MTINNPKLEKITINSIKGIKNKTFNLDLYPNKPSILVAPNGFGKSSFAIAFLSFNNNRLDLDDENLCQGNNLEAPSIEVIHNGNRYKIDESKNEYSANFDTFVINSPLFAKGKSQYAGGHFIPKASLEIKDIVIFKNIPENIKLKYSISEQRKSFGENGKILPKIDYLLDNYSLFCELTNMNLKDFEKKLTYINPLKKIKDKINSYSGTVEYIINHNEQEILSAFNNIDSLTKIKNLVTKYSNQESELLKFLESIQIIEIFKDPNYKKFITRCLYEQQKNELNSLIDSFNTTGLELKLKEETKGRRKNLVFKFPSANRISNGQRDILTFIAKLTKAKFELNKQNNLLIIDEIFDYLDDANLISFQYYITKFIEEYKKNDKNLYCILLTHLDPEYINNFCFSNHKLQIRYLMNTGTIKTSEIIKLIKKREVHKEISTYLFHFNNETKEIESYNNTQFYENLYQEVSKKYLKNKNYNSLKICLAVRIKIEETIYNKLNSQELKDDFIKTHRTKEKLNFAVGKGIDVPEIYFLLGIIYNDNLHWKENRDYETPLRTKLSNLVIRNMIKIIFETGEY